MVILLVLPPSPLPLPCLWYLWWLLGGGCRKGVPSTGLLGAAHLTTRSAGGIDECAGRAGPARLERRGDTCCFSFLPVPRVPGPPCPASYPPEGGWGGWSWLAEELWAAPVTEETGDLVPPPSSGGPEGCVLKQTRWGSGVCQAAPRLPHPVHVKGSPGASRGAESR